MATQAPRTMAEWRDLARHVGQPAQYSIDLSRYDARHASPRAEKGASLGLKVVAGQDSGHAANAARAAANQSAEVVNARAHVLKYDYERFHIAERQQRRQTPEARARQDAHIAELEARIRHFQREERDAFERAYKRELKKIPKTPRAKAAPKRERVYTVGSYTPEKVSIAEIAGARRNSRVLALERAAHEASSRRSPDATKAQEAYHRARDKEIVKLRAEASGAASPRTGTVATRARAAAKDKRLPKGRADAYVGAALHRAHVEKTEETPRRKPARKPARKRAR